jgi:hypothetical protein
MALGQLPVPAGTFDHQISARTVSINMKHNHPGGKIMMRHFGIPRNAEKKNYQPQMDTDEHR